MKRSKISEAVGNISEKYIEEAAQYRPKSRRGIIAASAAAAAVLILAVTAALLPLSKQLNPAVSKSDTDTHYSAEAEDIIRINRDDLSMAVADMDIIIEWYDINDLSDEVKDSFENRVGMAWTDFAARIPEGYTAEKMWSYLSRWDENGVRREEYSPFDYRFDISNPSGGRINMAVCGVSEPLRDCIIKCSGASPSRIDGVKMYIYEVGGTYYTIFQGNGIWYDIEAQLSISELTEFIKALI